MAGRAPAEGNGEIPRWCAFYWRAFGELTLGRGYVSETQLLPTAPGAPPLALISNRPLPLKWTTLNTYARRHRLEGDDFELFVRMVRSLDLEYLTVLAEQQAGQQGNDEEHG
jgi:hypothetical protein